MGRGSDIRRAEAGRPFTYGATGNHVWSFAGQDDRPDVSSTFLQPFTSYSTKDAWTFGLNTESTYNWGTHNWAVPINPTAGLRYWATAPDSGPCGLGFRVPVTFLFPK